MEYVGLFDPRTPSEKVRDEIIGKLSEGECMKVAKDEAGSVARAVEAKYGKHTASIRNVGETTFVVRVPARTPKPRIVKPPVVTE